MSVKFKHARVHDQADHQRDSLAQVSGTPSGAAENETWVDTNLRHLFARLGGVNGFYPQFKRRWSFITVRPGGSVDGLGETVTLTGTGSDPGLSANGNMVNIASAASAGSDAGVSGALAYALILNPLAVVRFKLQETTSVRAFVGLSSQPLATMVGSDNPAGHYAGLQFSTPRSDTNFQFVTKDGTTQGVSDSGLAVDTALHTLVIYLDNTGSRVVFQLDDTTQVIRTANLPGGTTALGLIAGVETQTSAARNLRFGFLQVESDG